MFPTTLDDYHIQAEELYRRAEKHRLVKSQSQTRELGIRISESLGIMLIELGEQLINKTQTAH
jgi:hypothetical protein